MPRFRIKPQNKALLLPRVVNPYGANLNGASLRVRGSLNKSPDGPSAERLTPVIARFNRLSCSSIYQFMLWMDTSKSYPKTPDLPLELATNETSTAVINQNEKLHGYSKFADRCTALFG